MKLPHDNVDPEGLQEFSVVFTDRSLNHMSARFQGVMRDVSGMLREVYNASAVALVPGGGTYAMEAVARQFGRGQVLDCIASGCIWVDMQTTGVDVLISAPQKGWSSSPAVGLVMLSAAAELRLAETTSNSFALDLKKWRSIMVAYDGGGHAYHATMPTDAIVAFRDAMIETKAMGYAEAKAAQWELGRSVRAMLAVRGVMSVAAEGYQAPGVVVSYTENPAVQNGSKFRAEGLQIAAGVPLQVGEGAEFRTFRLGLFGLDKIADVPGTVARLQKALDVVVPA